MRIDTSLLEPANSSPANCPVSEEIRALLNPYTSPYFNGAMSSIKWEKSFQIIKKTIVEFIEECKIYFIRY